MARSIQLNVDESLLPDLQKFYLQELEKAEKRVQELKQTLAKLKVGNQEAVKPINPAESEPFEEDASPTKGRRKKKAKGNRKKPRWSEFILELLKSKNQLMRVGTIIDEAVNEFEVEESEKKNTEQAIYNSLNRLRNVNKEVHSYSIPGKKGSYYGLKDWFEEDGKVKSAFAQGVV